MTPAKVGVDDLIAMGASGADMGALPREELAPTVQRQGDAIVLDYARHGVSLAFDAINERGDGLHAELVVTSIVLGEIHWGRLNLASTSAREQLVKKLRRHPKVPWPEILERACRAVALAVRAGVPIEPLQPRRADPTTRYLLGKLLVAGETNVLFADGGSGKSLLALAVAVALGLRVDLPAGLTSTRQVPTLYLDWESCKEEHEDRLAAILAGLAIREVPPIHYRPMQRALADDVAVLRRQVQRLGIGHVIVDSLAPASGSEPESTDAGVRTMNALRTLAPATRLVIAHLSKAAAEQRRGSAKPFGSVFVHNLARNAWELRRAEGEDSDDLILGLYHAKHNAGRKLPPFGLRFEFARDAIALRAHDLGTQPDLMARASLPFRIQNALSVGALTAAEIAEAIDARETSVSAKLRAMKSKGRVIRLDPDMPSGRARWGLPA